MTGDVMNGYIMTGDRHLYFYGVWIPGILNKQYYIILSQNTSRTYISKENISIFNFEGRNFISYVNMRFPRIIFWVCILKVRAHKQLVIRTGNINAKL